MVAEALRTFTPVSTSRPTPAALLGGLRAAAAEGGATEIVSVHLSGDMSGTFESAQLAARDASVPVLAVDTRQVGFATGYAVLAAADVAATPAARPSEAAEAALARAAATDVAVLRRHAGVPAPRRAHRRRGRAASAARWRSSRCCRSTTARSPRWRRCAPPRGRWPGWRSSPSRPRATHPVDVCVAHLASPDRAEQLAAQLAERAGREPRRSRGLVRRARRGARRARRARAWSRSAWRRALD